MHLRTRRVRRGSIAVALLVILSARSAAAQVSATAWAITARYTTPGTWAFPAARVAPGWALADELTLEPGSWSLVVGVGPRFAGRHGGVILLAGPVVASGDWYAGVFVAPSASVGRFTASGTFEFFVPVQRDEAFDWELSHARFFWAVTPRVRVGAILHATQSAGQSLQPEAGPSIRLRFAPGLDLIADAAIGLASIPGAAILTLEWEH